MWTSRETLPRQSQSNSEVVVLGGGRGLASVLRALRDEQGRLTAIVSVAYEDEGGDARLHLSGMAVDDMRRSLEALAADEGALVRAIRRSLTIDRVGRYQLGNLVIASVADVLGDYSRAGVWLGEQLGISGAVLTATAAPVLRQIPSAEGEPAAEPSLGWVHRPGRVRFIAGRVEAPGASIAAIKRAHWVLLAPGSLYRGVLSAAAVPDLASALRTTRARVLWIANLDRASREAADMSAIDHLLALRLHGVRLDAVMHDPSATLTFDPTQLTSLGVESVPRELRSSADPAVHDPELLRLALADLIDSRPTSAVRG